jgi:hypothetical protein
MEASGLNQWEIGDVKITRVVESEGPRDGTFILPNGTAENVQKESDWLYPAFSDQNGKLRMAIQALVIESQGKRIIVDTCIGNDKVRSNPEWNKLQLPFLQDLQKIGCSREAIDRVICTHLHIDHVGWNTMLKDGKWVPTFPNANYLIGGTEWDFSSRVDDPFLKDLVDDSVRPVMAEGISELVDDGYRITDEVWHESTPGHTPGHFAVRIPPRVRTESSPMTSCIIRFNSAIPSGMTISTQTGRWQRKHVGRSASVTPTRECCCSGRISRCRRQAKSRRRTTPSAFRWLDKKDTQPRRDARGGGYLKLEKQHPRTSGRRNQGR